MTHGTQGGLRGVGLDSGSGAGEGSESSDLTASSAPTSSVGSKSWDPEVLAEAPFGS
jgi:hypothetical protein